MVLTRLSFLFVISKCLVLQSISGQSRALFSQLNTTSLNFGTNSYNYSVVSDENVITEREAVNRSGLYCTTNVSLINRI